MIKSRWNGKNNVLELRKHGRSNFEDQSGVIGMRGNSPNEERVAVQFHVLGASDGCLLAVSKGNLLKGSAAISTYPNSRTAQTAFMTTIQTYQEQDKKAGHSSAIDVSFDRLHDNPAYSSDIGGTATTTTTTTNPNTTNSSIQLRPGPPPVSSSLAGKTN